MKFKIGDKVRFKISENDNESAWAGTCGIALITAVQFGGYKGTILESNKAPPISTYVTLFNDEITPIYSSYKQIFLKLLEESR